MSYPYGYGFRRANTPTNTKSIPQNVPYSQWAPQMWQQFTNLGNNFQDSQSFASAVHNLISQIPCPECKTDGESYVQSNPPEHVTSKAQAQAWVNAYHQHVNQKAGGWGAYDEDEDDDESEWYSMMWSHLHGSAENFDRYTFAPSVYESIGQIPCPGCIDHSLQFTQVNPPEEVQTQEEALLWMCEFHNWASQDAGNGLVDCELDPTGNGYISGHHNSSGFYYGGGKGGSQGGGGGGGHGGGRGGRGGGRGGGGRGGGGGGGGGGRGGHGGRRGHHGGGMMGGGQQGQGQGQGYDGYYYYY